VYSGKPRNNKLCCKSSTTSSFTMPTQGDSGALD
jgi:hypothetical protein